MKKIIIFLVVVFAVICGGLNLYGQTGEKSEELIKISLPDYNWLPIHYATPSEMAA